MTIAQQIKWDFDTNGSLEIKDRRENCIYWENRCGDWCRYEYDVHGNRIYSVNRHGSWSKKEYDPNGKQIYYEDSTGTIRDNRPKAIPEYTMEEAIALIGHDFKLKK
jgi:hypothetical protein